MDQHTSQLVQSLAPLLEIWQNLAWIVIVLFIPIFFKSAIEDFVYGIMWRFRSDFNNRDIVRINRREWARIVHIGPLRTEFTVFEFTEGEDGPVGGFTRFIANSNLRGYDIDKPLQLVSYPKALKDMAHPGVHMK